MKKLRAVPSRRIRGHSKKEVRKKSQRSVGQQPSLMLTTAPLHYNELTTYIVPPHPNPHAILQHTYTIAYQSKIKLAEKRTYIIRAYFYERLS